ncbi:uncharacterized protein LOC116851928 isoform X1 [Odontomachus brunneus]|uniref:uncharacterized protein LOC116851928 isoform X1 n=1 Tax=Odontomachus brunneus TaxID=486640 RepID=UPI0013F1C3BD|nr:uncharacterized protein LOC116851928 isoform X1 [Odontomachus brunneus]XP_032687751.1 uncharacterized protein LOC116851928 isoform X1 [Odontomachus brunneus]
MQNLICVRVSIKVIILYDYEINMDLSTMKFQLEKKNKKNVIYKSYAYCYCGRVLIVDMRFYQHITLAFYQMRVNFTILTSDNKNFIKYAYVKNEESIKKLPWGKKWVYCMLTLNNSFWQQKVNECIFTRDPEMLTYLVCNNNVTYYLLMSNESMNKLMGYKRLAEHYRLMIKKYVKRKTMLKYILEKLYDRILFRFFEVMFLENLK